MKHDNEQMLGLTHNCIRSVRWTRSPFFITFITRVTFQLAVDTANFKWTGLHCETAGLLNRTDEEETLLVVAYITRLSTSPTVNLTLIVLVARKFFLLSYYSVHGSRGDRIDFRRAWVNKLTSAVSAGGAVMERERQPIQKSSSVKYCIAVYLIHWADSPHAFC